MTSESLKSGLISETLVKDALVKSKGDLFYASSYLGVSLSELDKYIRRSEELQLAVSKIEKIKSNGDYDKLSTESFKQALEVKTRHYRDEAIDEIYKLATIPIGEGEEKIGAAMAEVKLRAAIKLAGDSTDNHVVSDTQNILIELNRQYQASAPRIKSIRVSQIEFEQSENIIDSD